LPAGNPKEILFKMRKQIILVVFLIITISCQTNYKPLFYKLSDFNIVAGNQFIKKIESLSSIQKISIIDTDKERNQFKVNDVTIFNDTLQIDKPNYYSYLKFAKETNIDKEKLNEALTNFNQIKVSEFIRKNDFYLFPVEKYALAKQNGYLYTHNIKLKVNDTLFAEEVYGKKIILRKSIDKNWFEYVSEK
jgi:hypothetical protein